MGLDELFDKTIQQALAQAQAKSIAIYTFAFYFDHESRAVSVCIDTEENSSRVVNKMNSYNQKHFLDAVVAGDLHRAAMWQANIGRSLLLGDFLLVNLARADVTEADIGDEFFISMVRAVVRNQPAIVGLSADKARLILCCSGPNDEVQLCWSASETPR
jgi:hypothetical protein